MGLADHMMTDGELMLPEDEIYHNNPTWRGSPLCMCAEVTQIMRTHEGAVA